MDREEIIRNARMRIQSMEEEPRTEVQPPNHTPTESSNDASRYQHLELIGEGSIGEIFKAYDTVLKRSVALKFVKASGPDTEQRFLREARAQAAVQNPNICKVYDVGKINNQSFIAMQYVHGPTLGVAAQQMNLKQKVELMKKVAEAVHAANRSGLVHRDIKPGNILVEKTEKGWEPYVTDFGLAREVHAPDVTRTGVIIGTPAYMSPEQARGTAHEVDQRTDVYSLGATFYELLSGKPPFEGSSSLEVLLKIFEQEVPPMKNNQQLPKELETIVMKCLEKDPRRRYESARAFSEDLARFLDSEPILAQPVTWHYRLLKKTRKHRALVVIAAAALVGVILSAGFALYVWWNAAERAKYAQQFGQEVEEIEGFLRYVQTLPLHDIRPEIKIVRDKMKAIESTLKQTGSPGKGPGHYALGRGHLSLHEHEKALSHLQEAWKENYRTPEVAYALGAVFGELYQKQLQTLQQFNPEEREKRQEEMEKKYRGPALHYLRAAKGVRIQSAHYLEGLIGLYEGKFDLALKKSQDSIRSAPWFYQSKKLEGDIYLSLGIEKAKSGQYQIAKENYEKAGASYKQAMEVGRSDAAIYEAECGRRIEILNVSGYEKNLINKSFQDAIDSCDMALRINKENASIFNKMSFIYYFWGSTLSKTGEDPQPMLRKTIEVAQAAIQLNPQLSDAHNRIGDILWVLARKERARGNDFKELLENSIHSYNASLKIQPNAQTYKALGRIYILKGNDEIDHGVDPQYSFRNGIDSYQKAIQMDSSDATYHIGLGNVYELIADYDFNHGKNPDASLVRVMDCYQKALQINPNNMAIYSNLAESYITKAKHEISQKRNPSNSLDRSIALCKQALSQNPDFSPANENMGMAYRMKASHAAAEGKDPSDFLNDARNAFAEVIPEDVDQTVSLEEAETELIAAEWAITKGYQPADILEKVRLNLEKSLSTSPSKVTAYCLYAKYHFLNAQLLHGQKAVEEIQKGIENAVRASSTNPRSADAFGIQGELLFFKSQITDQESERQKSKELIRKAVELNKNLHYKYADLLDG